MITHITVEDAAKLISRLTNANEMQALTYIREAVDRGEIHAADALEKLQAENESLKNKLHDSYQGHLLDVVIPRLESELEKVKAERDAAVEAVKNMAEYIVCAGRVDYYLCDEISQEHHLKYQPKNDGNYDNEPCYKCIEDWFLQGNKW